MPSPDGLFVYVINKGDSSVQEFGVQSDGSLKSQNTYKINGSSPTAAAIDPAGKFLYVTFTYQTGYSAGDARARRSRHLPRERRSLARRRLHGERRQ